MSPIYIPPQPVPIIRQKIRNQADIQEQLRAYDQQQQDLVGANAAAFNATNIDKQVLYPKPAVTEPISPARMGEVEQKTETEPPDAPPRQAAEEEEERRQLRPPARGRPRGGEKTVDELKAAIRATGRPPIGLATMRKLKLQVAAKQLGIDLMR